MQPDIIAEKERIRKYIINEKRKYSRVHLKNFSDNILSKLENKEVFQRANIIFMYWSLPGEVDTHDFINKWGFQKSILLPVINGNSLDLKLFEGMHKLKKNNRFNIFEPTGKIFNDLDIIDLAIIPGMAFDKNMNRMGRGKGYYDRLLNSLKSIKIGICFPFQLLDQIPVDRFDIKMDEVISC